MLRRARFGIRATPPRARFGATTHRPARSDWRNYLANPQLRFWRLPFLPLRLSWMLCERTQILSVSLPRAQHFVDRVRWLIDCLPNQPHSFAFFFVTCSFWQLAAATGATLNSSLGAAITSWASTQPPRVSPQRARLALLPALAGRAECFACALAPEKVSDLRAHSPGGRGFAAVLSHRCLHLAPPAEAPMLIANMAHVRAVVV